MNREGGGGEGAGGREEEKGGELCGRGGDGGAGGGRACVGEGRDRGYEGTGEISPAMARVKDISVLMPLWCGVAPLDRAEHVRKLLLDRKHFASTWPIPSLSMAERSYNPEGHWHGSSWIEISDLIILGLKDYGYYSDAAKLACLTTRMAFEELERCSHFREYFNPETGAGIGLFDYIW